MTNMSTPLRFTLNYAKLCGGGGKFDPPEK